MPVGIRQHARVPASCPPVGVAVRTLFVRVVELLPIGSPTLPLTPMPMQHDRGGRTARCSFLFSSAASYSTFPQMGAIQWAVKSPLRFMVLLLPVSSMRMVPLTLSGVNARMS